MKKVRSNAAMLDGHHLSNALVSSCISVTFSIERWERTTKQLEEIW